MTLRIRNLQKPGVAQLAFTEIGFGSAPLGNLYRAISDEDADVLLDMAWTAGIRYFDTAPLYGFGLSETRLNRFLRGKPRNEYLLSTKVGRLLRAVPVEQRDGIGKWFEVPSRREIYDYSYDGVMRSFESSLERLGVDRVDILLAHDLDLFNHGDQQTLDVMLAQFMAGGYHALLKLRDEGVIQAFGAGINAWQPCQWMAERGDFDLFLLAGRYTLLEQEPLDSFLPLCKTRGIGIILGGPYNSGILATGSSFGASYNYTPAPDTIRQRVARIEAVCRLHDVRMVDVAFQFPLNHPAVVSVIPGAQSLPEMQSNLSAARSTIPPAVWADLKANDLMRQDAPTG